MLKWNEEGLPSVWFERGSFSETVELLSEAFADSIFKSVIVFYREIHLWWRQDFFLLVLEIFVDESFEWFEAELLCLEVFGSLCSFDDDNLESSLLVITGEGLIKLGEKYIKEYSKIENV